MMPPLSYDDVYISCLSTHLNIQYFDFDYNTAYFPKVSEQDNPPPRKQLKYRTSELKETQYVLKRGILPEILMFDT